MIQHTDILVAGGGHAGIEAAHAAWKMGLRVVLLTLDPQNIGRMSCNPAIGGVGKGQMVRDIDALGGLMGILADQTGIQFRMLNLSKGPAVWGPRCQSDMTGYEQFCQSTLAACDGLQVMAGELAALRWCGSHDHQHSSVENWEATTEKGETLFCRAVIITSGTFLGGKLFLGLEESTGGRIREGAANHLTQSLQDLKIQLRRLKTGTPSRLDPDSIFYDQTQVQQGDLQPWAFSSRTQAPLKNHAVCWITRTTLETHGVLREGFSRSPMFTGKIKGIGPRYCPSIEDKINRFADKNSHQLFLEPEGVEGSRIYVNGFSSSLPADIQQRALRTIPGLQECRILQYGYAVEYDSIDATQLHPTLECKAWPNLFFAGQVCGTSGYEEAAAQGLIAGINAALNIQGKEPFLLGRSDSYIGVMLDDLVRLQLEEPYRMFTSRAEYRLFLRYDNAEDRLRAHGRRLGLVDDEDWNHWQQRLQQRQQAEAFLQQESVVPEIANQALTSDQPLKERCKWIQVLRRPGVQRERLFDLAGIHDLGPVEMLYLHSQELYRGFYDRQEKEIAKRKRLEGLHLPANFDYDALTSLSFEGRQQLKRHQPMTIGLAGGIPGVRPADITVLLHALENR